MVCNVGIFVRFSGREVYGGVGGGMVKVRLGFLGSRLVSSC